MDLDERIEEFRNSLPEKKREAFDSLPHEYKQTLIDPEAIKKMAQASLNAAGVMKRTPAKLPSFPAPYSLPGSFLDELDRRNCCCCDCGNYSCYPGYLQKSQKE